MAFAIRNKETGELWKGQNYRNHKVYATAAAAKSALSSYAKSNTWKYNGPEVFLGLTTNEYNAKLREGLEPLQRASDRAQENYRRVSYDYPNDKVRWEIARDEWLVASKAYYDQLDKNKRAIREAYMKWEVVEV